MHHAIEHPARDISAHRPGLASALRRTMASLARAVPVLLATLAILAAAVPARPAAAQSARDVAATPITSRFLVRQLRAFVGPTEAESAAIDALHERYLEKFRAELDPEITALTDSLSGRMPTKQEFDAFLRNMDRVAARIAEADDAFVASATQLVAEERRAGFERVREARERARALMGVGRLGAMMFGSGANFVDLPELLVRCEPLAERRVDYTAFLEDLSRRTLAQSRAHASSLRTGISRFFDAMQPVMAAAETRAANGKPPTDEELGQAQQAYFDAMSAVGEANRRGVRANFDMNRAALARVGEFFDEPTALDIREEVVRRVLNEGTMLPFGLGKRLDLEALGDRLARDERVPTELRARIAELVLAWRRDHVARAEAWTSVAVSRDGQQAELMGGPEDLDDGGEEAARAGMRASAEKALAQIAALIGSLAEEYTAKVELADGGERLVVRLPKKPDTGGGDDDDAGGAPAAPSWVFRGFAASGEIPQNLDSSVAVRVARVLGVEGVDPGVLDAIASKYRDDEWEPAMAPLRERIANAQQNLHSATEDGRLMTDMTRLAELRAARLEAARRLFELDERQIVALSGVLGLGADHPFALLMRLERIGAIGSRPSGNQTALLVPPSGVLASASLDGATAATIVEAARPTLASIAESMPSLLQAALERAHRMSEAEVGFSSRDQQTVVDSSQRYRETIGANQRADADLVSRLGRALEDAAQVAGGDELREKVRRARMREVHPDAYRIEDGLDREFAAVGRLPDLSPDALGAVEALRAEYEAIFDKMSEQLIAPAFDIIPGDGSPEAWRDYARRMEEIERVRFKRTEFVDKIRAALARAIGPAQAARVPGLVRESAGVEARRARMAADDPNAD